MIMRNIAIVGLALCLSTTAFAGSILVSGNDETLYPPTGEFGMSAGLLVEWTADTVEFGVPSGSNDADPPLADYDAVGATTLGNFGECYMTLDLTEARDVSGGFIWIRVTDTADPANTVFTFTMHGGGIKIENSVRGDEDLTLAFTDDTIIVTSDGTANFTFESSNDGGTTITNTVTVPWADLFADPVDANTEVKMLGPGSWQSGCVIDEFKWTSDAITGDNILGPPSGPEAPPVNDVAGSISIQGADANATHLLTEGVTYAQTTWDISGDWAPSGIVDDDETLSSLCTVGSMGTITLLTDGVATGYTGFAINRAGVDGDAGRFVTIGMGDPANDGSKHMILAWGPYAWPAGTCDEITVVGPAASSPEYEMATNTINGAQLESDSVNAKLIVRFTTDGGETWTVADEILYADFPATCGINTDLTPTLTPGDADAVIDIVGVTGDGSRADIVEFTWESKVLVGDSILGPVLGGGELPVVEIGTLDPAVYWDKWGWWWSQGWGLQDDQPTYWPAFDVWGAFAAGTGDVTGNGIPDKFELGMVCAGLANSIHGSGVDTALVANGVAIEASDLVSQGGEWWWGAPVPLAFFATISQAWCDAIEAQYPALDGLLAPYTYDTGGKVVVEPLAADGDFDGDGYTNLEEYRAAATGDNTVPAADQDNLILETMELATTESGIWPFVASNENLPAAGGLGLGLLAAAAALGGAVALRRKQK